MLQIGKYAAWMFKSGCCFEAYNGIFDIDVEENTHWVIWDERYKPISRNSGQSRLRFASDFLALLFKTVLWRTSNCIWAITTGGLHGKSKHSVHTRFLYIYSTFNSLLQSWTWGQSCTSQSIWDPKLSGTIITPTVSNITRREPESLIVDETLAHRPARNLKALIRNLVCNTENLVYIAELTNSGGALGVVQRKFRNLNVYSDIMLTSTCTYRILVKDVWITYL